MNRALTAILDGIAPFFRRRITTNWTLPRSTKVGESRESNLMIAVNPGVGVRQKPHISLTGKPEPVSGPRYVEIP